MKLPYSPFPSRKEDIGIIRTDLEEMVRAVRATGVEALW
jgi:hypothetical protein